MFKKLVSLAIATAAISGTALANVPKGWPNYITMGGVTLASTDKNFKGINADFIMKYAGNGAGDRGHIAMPIFTYNTAKLAEVLTSDNRHNVKPLMVAYTGQMSGGTSFFDFSDKNLKLHFADLILMAQVLNLPFLKNVGYGSIVLNPDLLGMVQQEKLFNEKTGNLNGLGKLNNALALSQAVWFITKKHNWHFKLSSGKSFVATGTPIQIMENIENGAYKDKGVYSPWDLQQSFQAQAEHIMSKAPNKTNLILPTFASNFLGWIQATNYALRKYAPNVTFGWQLNIWSSGTANWIHNKLHKDIVETPAQIQADTIKTADTSVDIIKKLGVYSGQYKPDFLAFDKYATDATSSIGAGYWWNDWDWNRYMQWVKEISDKLGQVPVMLWQEPGTHILMGSHEVDKVHSSVFPNYLFGHSHIKLNRKYGAYNINVALRSTNLQDDLYQCSKTSTPKHDGCTIGQYLEQGGYDYSRDHFRFLKSANVFSVEFGEGNSTSISEYPRSDGGWLSKKVNNYEKHPVTI